jgi:peptidoglycan/xylan/chitin deacetylase (PgdA/CDA1 family)
VRKLETVSIPLDGLNLPKWFNRQDLHVPHKWALEQNLLQDSPNLENLSLKSLNELRNLTLWTDTKPLSSKLPFPYFKIPGTVRSLTAKLIGKTKKSQQKNWASFPKWPLDLTVDFLTDLVSQKTKQSNKTPVWLTHDIDSFQGLKNLEKMFLDLEEKYNARSTNFIVPCQWKLDYALTDQIYARRHEIGVHGYDHSNKTAFLSQSSIKDRISKGFKVVERYNPSGYRSPSLLRSPLLLKTVQLFYNYDSSIPTSGGLFPVPNNGCATARPFSINGTNEIPLSMPRDGSMLFLGQDENEILKTWINSAKTIASSGGTVVLLTHCEEHFSGNKKMLTTYEKFLEYIATSDRFAFRMPRDFLKD